MSVCNVNQTTARNHSTSPLSPTLGTQTRFKGKTRNTCHKLDATIILMFRETIIKCGNVVITLVTVANTSRHNNEKMGNKTKTQVPGPCHGHGMSMARAWTVRDRGRRAHSESLAMTFDKILFQST